MKTLWKRMAALAVLALFIMSIVPVYAAHPQGALDKWAANAAGECTKVQATGSTQTYSTPMGEFTVEIKSITGEKVELTVNNEEIDLSTHDNYRLANGVEFYTFGAGGSDQNDLKFGFDCQGAGQQQINPKDVELVYCRVHVPQLGRYEYSQTIRAKCNGEELSESQYVLQVAAQEQERRQAYEAARERLQEAREAYHAQRTELRGLKQQAQACTADTQECREVKLTLKKGILQHLLTTAELIDSSLAKLEKKVELSTIIRGGQKEELFAAILKLEERITEQRLEVEALAADPEDTTNAELRTAIRDLKHTWQDVRKLQQRVVSVMVSNKLNSIVKRAEQELGESMSQKVGDVKKAGTAAPALEEAQQNYDAKVTALKEAQEQWEQQHSRQNLQALQETLQEVKQSLRQFTQEYKRAQQEESPVPPNQEEEGNTVSPNQG